MTAHGRISITQPRNRYSRLPPDDGPWQDQYRPAEEQTIGVGTGLVDLPEHCQKSAGEERSRKQAHPADCRIQSEAPCQHHGRNDAALYQREFCQRAKVSPVPCKEDRDPGNDQHRAGDDQETVDVVQ